MAISKNKGPRKTKVFQMPSGAYPYREFFPEGNVGVHSFNFDVEQILAGNEEGQQKMNMITPMVIQLPEGFQVGQLLTSDQFYLLMASRSMSFGEDYSFTTTCPSCGKPEKHTYALPDGLPINRLPDDFEEPYEFKLPDCGDTVGIRLLTINDETVVDNYAKQRKLNHEEPGDPGYKYRLARHIVHVNGEEPENMEDAVAYVTSLDGRDPAEFRQKIESATPGVRPLLKIQCPQGNCGTVYEAAFRVTAEFFRPQR